MNELFQIFRALIRDELRALRTGDTAVVTASAPHAEGDAHNHHCDIRLRPGGLALTRVPLHNAQVGAVADARIWLYAPRESEVVPTRWTTIDVRDPDAPITGPVVPVKVGAKLDYADTLAVGSRRALVIVGGSGERELVLLDPTTALKVMDVLVDQVRRHRTSVVLVTHSEAAAARADRVLHLAADGIRA